MNHKSIMRVYDFDMNWDVPDGADEHGKYVLREVRYISDDGSALLRNGTRSNDYREEKG